MVPELGASLHFLKMPTDELPTPEDILDAHKQIEEEYDLKYKGVRTAAPRIKLRQEVLEPAAEYDDPYYRAAVLLWKIESVPSLRTQTNEQLGSS